MNFNYIVKGSWGTVELNSVQAMVYLVDKCFTPFFRGSINHDTAIVLNDPYTNPWCDRTNRTIWLNTCSNDWHYYVFEFAHELCHYHIRKDRDEVGQSLRWFEESICELASIFTMRAIRQYSMRQTDSAGWYVLGAGLLERLNREEQKAIPINLDFSDYTSIELQMLVDDEYQREKNTFIALQLLPIFERQPYLWSTVPLLGRVPEWVAIDEFIRMWYRLSAPEFSDSIIEVSNVFNIAV